MKIVEFLKDIFLPGKTVYVNQKFETEKYKLAIEAFAFQMAINIIAGMIAKCEVKTFVNGKEVREDEYYTWNVEPNVNQNSSQFIQELISKLLENNEVLVVEASGQLLIADSFNPTPYALFPNTFTGVTVGDFTFNKTFYMQDVLYFKLNNQNVRALLSGLMAGYSQLLDMAVGKYKRAGGRKGVARINRTKSGDKDFEAKVDDFFNKKMRKYFNDENAVVNLPNGIEYEEITGEGSKKSTSEVTDIVSITKEAISRVAQALRMPPSLLLGDISDVSKLMDETLTICIDPIIDLIQTEVNRKRYGKKRYLGGTYLKIDTTCIKHIDIFDVAESADKLIADGIYSVDELRVKLGEMPLNTWWSQKHWMTKNYSELEAAEPPQINTGTGGDTG